METPTVESVSCVGVWVGVHPTRPPCACLSVSIGIASDLVFISHCWIDSGDLHAHHLLFFSCSFQASSDLDRNQWVESLSTAIMTGLDLRPQTLPRGGSRINNSQVRK